MTAFEDFLNLEIPKRVVLLTEGNTGYTGNPNLAVDAAINGAPQGTLFIDNTGPNYIQYVKQVQAVTASWVVVGSLPSPTDIASTLYTLVSADAGARLRFTAAVPVTVTVPPVSAVPWQVGQIIYGIQYGDGEVIIAAGAGVTVQRPSSNFASQTLEKYAQFTLIYEGSNVWTLGGALASA